MDGKGAFGQERGRKAEEVRRGETEERGRESRGGGGKEGAGGACWEGWREVGRVEGGKGDGRQ